MANKFNDIERYRKGLMTDAERHSFEKKALTDPFLSDALEGAESVTPEEFSDDVQSISTRIASQSSRSQFTAWRIAAAVAGLIALGSLLYLFQPSSPLPEAAVETDDSSYVASEVGKANSDSLASLLALNKPDQERPKKTMSSPSVFSQPDGKSHSEEAVEMTEQESSNIKPVDDKGREALIDEAQQSQQTAKEKNLAMPVVAKPDAWSGGLPDSERKKENLKSRSIVVETAKDDGGRVDQVIQGVVTSALDRTPIPGVSVVVKGSGNGTVTDANGHYRLRTTTQNPELVFSFIGFQKEEIAVKTKKSVNIALAEEVVRLSEIVVVGQAPEQSPADELRTPQVKMASPVGGMRAYNKYLENSLRYPEEALVKKIKGKVIVQFTVTTNGTLTSFEVIKGIGYGCDDEVIRIVKEGPAWIPTTQDNIAVESEVKVSMKFNPEKARE